MLAFDIVMAVATQVATVWLGLRRFQAAIYEGKGKTGVGLRPIDRTVDVLRVRKIKKTQCFNCHCGNCKLMVKIETTTMAEHLRVPTLGVC